MQIGLGIALRTGLGAALSIMLGAGSACLVLGIAVGIVIGAALTRIKTNDQRLATNDAFSHTSEKLSPKYTRLTSGSLANCSGLP